MKSILFLSLFFLIIKIRCTRFSSFDESNYFKTGEYLYEFGFFKLNVYKVYFYCKSKLVPKQILKMQMVRFILNSSIKRCEEKIFS